MSHLAQTLKDAVWLNAPESWQMREGGLTMTTSDKTDFWQKTHYGFRRDDGHFLGRDVAGDFTATLTFEADYQTLYDQAGLMMRADPDHWLKTGIEHSDGIPNVSTVVTRGGHSDWSVVGVPGLGGPQTIRLTRVGGAVITHMQRPDGRWALNRLANFPADMPVRVGPMACSPERAGLVVRFLDFQLGPAIDDPLHAP
jgi:regulation of enolase protein 1 (concanavalin A-like superfamily)